MNGLEVSGKTALFQTVKKKKRNAVKYLFLVAHLDIFKSCTNINPELKMQGIHFKVK